MASRSVSDFELLPELRRLDAQLGDTASQPAGSEALCGFWYLAAPSASVRGSKLLHVELLGDPIAIGRDASGKAFALRDVCPHRGMPLSAGRCDGRVVECCYHGWQFQPHTGQCLSIPSLTSDAKIRVDRIYCGAYACEERDGYIWVYMSEQPQRGTASGALPNPPQLEVFSERYRLARVEADLPTSIDHGVIGLMDPAHGPFVHQSWWWRSRKSIQVKEKVFEPIPYGFRMRAHQPSANSGLYKLLRVYHQPIQTRIDFVLPAQRLEVIRCGPYWFSSRATVTPLAVNRCRLDFIAAWNLFRWVPFVTPLVRLLARQFVGQDVRVMEKQAVGLRYHPSLMLVDDADRPARWYFQLKKAWQDSRKTGQPFEHPLSGPVTLHWRS
jgi:phenylpropionate dioxygenase-like ring-hydroxylating dioxygenase large terminal subunit